MGRKRLSVEQTVAVPKRVGLGLPVGDGFGRSESWTRRNTRGRKQYSGLQADRVRELKHLQEENARLNKLVAELSLGEAILWDINSKKWPGPR